MKKFFPICLSLCLCLSLCSCGSGNGAEKLPASSRTEDSAPPAAGDAPPASEAQEEYPTATPTPEPGDGLEGAYFNDYLETLLVIDGRGGFRLSGGREASGSYTSSGAEILFLAGGVEEKALVDADGDIRFTTMTGHFLKDWEKWNISLKEVQVLTESNDTAAAEPVYEPQGDGRIRCSNYSRGLSFLYQEDMSVLEMLSGTVVVSSGKAYVLGRNATEDYGKGGEDAGAYLKHYMENSCFADLQKLYGSLEKGEVRLLEESVEGRLASGEMSLFREGQELYVKTILYTSTFGDGTENHICKTIVAPAGDNESFNAMAESVLNMGAVRLK